MLVPVGVLAVLAVVGGWIQFSPFWHPLTNWLEPVGAHARRRRAEELAGGALLRPRRRARARGHRRRLGALRRPAASPCRACRRSSARSSTSSTSTRRTTGSSTRRPLRSPDSCTRTAEDESILPVGGEFGEVTLETRAADAAPADRPPPHLRPLPRHRDGRDGDRLPAGAMTVSSLTSLLIWLPIGAALVVWLAAALALRDGRARRARLARRGRHLDRAGGPLRLRAAPACSSRRSTPWIRDLHVSYHVGEYGFSLWLVGLTVVAMAACIGYGFWVGRDRPARVLRADALPDRRDRRRVRRRRTCCSSTRSSRRC